MRCLYRNMQSFYYASFVGKTPMFDTYGNETGEYKTEYSTPVVCAGNISAVRGETAAQQFGENETFDRVIVLADANTPIDEHAVLWVDCVPAISENGNTDTPWDFTVKKVARSLNSAAIAISKVNIA